MDLVASRLGTENEYKNFGFTHDTKHIAEGPKTSAYKLLNKMEDKLKAQMELAIKIRAVDEEDVASKVIQTHFLPNRGFPRLNLFSACIGLIGYPPAVRAGPD